MTPFYKDDTVTLWHGDALEVMRELPDGSVNCCVTSPPYYGLRDYGIEGQYGLEESPAAYVETMRALFAEVRRVLHDDGTLWLNIGDSYSAGFRETTMPGNGVSATPVGSHGASKSVVKSASDVPAKNLLGIPWRVAFALQDDGWILRNDIIWAKPNAMPESVTDRLSTKHEHLFMFAKQSRYWFDLNAIREPLLHPDALDRNIKFGGNNADQYGNPTYSGNTYGRAGRPEATPPGNTPQTNFGPVGVRNGKFHENGKNPGDVWSIPTQPYSAAHFAVMAQQLASRAIQAGCKPGGVVLDPFSGSGTTGLAAAKHGRRYVGIDLNADYLELSMKTRLSQPALMDEL